MSVILIRIFAAGLVGCGPSDGPYVDHYPNGQVKEKGTYRDGQKSGQWVFYWQDGAKKTEGYYTRSVPSGTWMFYDRQGRLIGQGTYRDGKVWDGTFVRYVVGTTKVMRFKEGREEVKR